MKQVTEESLIDSDVTVEDEYLAYVMPAKIFALTVYRLMKDNAKMAKENIESYKSAMTKEEYIAFMDSLQTREVVEPTPLPLVK